jgi:hypothetical protein
VGTNKVSDQTADPDRQENECSMGLLSKSTLSDTEDKDIRKETLKPVTKVNSKLDKELQDWEVESTKGGGDLNE